MHIGATIIFPTKRPLIAKDTGRLMADNILINTIIPFLFTYGWHNRQDQLVERSIRWLKCPRKEPHIEGI